MSRYLLPCTCGKTIPVSLAQAGGSATCDCGQSVRIPSIRGMRDLPPAPESAAEKFSKEPPPAVNVLGAVFALGLVLFVIGGLIAAYSTYVVTQIDTSDHHAEVQTWAEEQIDDLEPAQLFNTWKKVTDPKDPESGLGQHQPPHHILAREIHKQYLWMAIVSGIVGTVGLIGIVASLLMSRGGQTPSRNDK